METRPFPSLRGEGLVETLGIVPLEPSLAELFSPRVFPQFSLLVLVT